METADKVRENLIRRRLKRQGLELRKSRRRDPKALDFGKYWIVVPVMFDSHDELEEAAEREDTEEWIEFDHLDDVETWMEVEGRI